MTDLERAIGVAKEIQVLPDGPVIMTKEQGRLLASALLSVAEENKRLKKIEKLYPGIVADWEAAETAKGILELKFEDTSAKLSRAEEVIRFVREKTETDPAGEVELRARAACVYKEVDAYFASSRENKGEG